jgi:alpha-mannosidase
MPYEKHHVRLVKLMDTLLELLERDAGFRSFHLDGQTIVLDDYLQVRPDQRERVMRHIADGRLIVGPWYILQDEFLTSSEANVRNLLIGMREAARYGAVAKIGYFPDSFGNMGQAPQILKQAGIEAAVFGRGVKPTGFNNAVADAETDESPYSEIIWQAPDGSEVLGILFANWYNNGMEIPSAPEEAKRYWERKIADAERFASTPHLLLMNGCDHQPVQTDLTRAIETARRLFPEVEFVHSNFPDYVRAVSRDYGQRLSVVKGELRSLRTDGWGTLVNTASARVYIKQANQQCQTLLEKSAEPLAAFAALQGAPYPRDLLTYAWKTLMQNHPHDSICGCSIDDVHREMMTRFAKSRAVAEAIIDDSAAVLASAADTSVFGDRGGAKPFVVFNTSGQGRSGTVTIELEIARIELNYAEPQRQRAALAALPAEGRVVDSTGAEVPCRIEDLGVRFGYALPDDRFREPYWARVVRITMHAEDVPALGYAAYAWIPLESAAQRPTADQQKLLKDDRTMENEWIRVRIADNGTLTLEDKRNGRIYTGLCEYEDTGDIGNEYMYRQPDGDKALTTGSLKADVRVVEDESFRAEFEIVHHWAIPRGADALLTEERESFVPFTERRAQRSSDCVPLTLRTRVALEKSSPLVRIRVSFDNQAKDHRLRVLFPTGIESAVHAADSIFEVAVRPNEPAPEWNNPSFCHHQQTFAAVDDAGAGLMSAGLGLHEYEVLRDGRNTIALTLLRAVGELGDWGVFPTPEAQCIGPHQMEFAVIPYAGVHDRNAAANWVYQYPIPWIVRQTGVHPGALPPRRALLEWEGANLALSAVKIAEQTDDLIVRWFNLSSAEDTRLTVAAPAGSAGAGWYRSSILEERIGDMDESPAGTDRWATVVRRAEILTLGCAVPR